jgi:glutaredoxin
MDYSDIEPSENSVTVYSKSGCNNCVNVKNLLKDYKKKHSDIEFNIIDCDEYLIEDKSSFLYFIQNKANEERKIFPIVFINKKFIGGFTETKEYFEKTYLDFE